MILPIKRCTVTHKHHGGCSMTLAMRRRSLTIFLVALLVWTKLTKGEAHIRVRVRELGFQTTLNEFFFWTQVWRLVSQVKRSIYFWVGVVQIWLKSDVKLELIREPWHQTHVVLAKTWAWGFIHKRGWSDHTQKVVAGYHKPVLMGGPS